MNLLNTPEDIKMGLGFTLSHPVTAALTPGDIRLFRTALSVSDSIKPLKDNEIQQIKEKALMGEPLFKYPRTMRLSEAVNGYILISGHIFCRTDNNRDHRTGLFHT